jgi:hypothetical protein
VTRLALELSDDVVSAANKFFSGDMRNISVTVDNYLRHFLRRWKMLPPRRPWGIKKGLKVSR